jgi:plasmid maintenance system antidote protein VapI
MVSRYVNGDRDITTETADSLLRALVKKSDEKD